MSKEKYIGLMIGFIISQFMVAPVLGLSIEQVGDRMFFTLMGVLGCYIADRWDFFIPKLKKLTKLRIVIKDEDKTSTE